MTTTTPAAILADRCPELATVDRFEILTPELTFELDKAAGGVGSSTGRYRLVTHFRLTGGGDEVARFAEEVVFRGPPPNRPSASADDSGALGDPGKPVDLMATGAADGRLWPGWWLWQPAPAITRWLLRR